MTKISFYKVSGGITSAVKLAAELTEKSAKKRCKVLWQVSDETFVKEIDQVLWSFSDASFVPHSAGPLSDPVGVSKESTPGIHHEVLINFQQNIPAWFSRFEQIIEVIYNDPKDTEIKREHFRFYKDRGYETAYIDLSNEKFPSS
ncbi:MAG: hypothetical protein CMK30_00835 [Porticoccaceae bacterium]|nr:hypothetical protein [Porticoccaceae bacterium]|tara:strand:+ start:9514 stop:9948 length:435 start_codon:yes stop_codon:yes gene_type:complete